MRRWRLGCFRAGLVLLAQVPVIAASGGGDFIVVVVDSRRYSGWKAWSMNLYNESHLWFALLTVVTIPLLGLAMGKLTDLALSRIGLNLKSRVLAEH